LEAGLSIDSKERYIPPTIGTRSFIDIVAHDRSGRIVLIEVKKTDAAARQATHELLKYLEAVKSHLRLREDEIRLFVASPEWGELLVPFSSLVSRTTCSVSGFHLSVSPTGDVTDASPVEPVAMQNGRLIAPWHEVRYYSLASEAEKSILDYQSSCANKGIESFVILELAPPPEVDGIHSPKQATMHDMLSAMAPPSQRKAPSLPKYARVLYFAMQQLSEQEYRSLLIPRLEPDSDTLEYLEVMEGDELLCSMHEALLDLNPHPSCDFLEIGYPAKLKSRLFDEDGWLVSRVHRFGAFERNSTILSDALLIEEVCGSEGVSLQRFTRAFDPSDKTQAAEALKGVDRCLRDNKAWRKQIHNALEETPEIRSAPTTKISIFNPSTALLTFYLAVSSEDGTQYIPEYSIVTEIEDKTVAIYGCLVWDGSKANLKSVLRKHYEDSIPKMTFPLMWGGYDEIDPAVLRTIGLTYKTFRVDVTGDQREHYKLTEDGWETTEPVHPYADFFLMYKENPELMAEVCELYASRWSDGILDMS
jgi:hypothetical protein